MNQYHASQNFKPTPKTVVLDSDRIRMRALVKLGRILKDNGYRFTTVTPATHRIVNARIGNEWASSLEDVLGWSRPFRTQSVLPNEISELMVEAQILKPHLDGWKSTLRASTLDENLYFHSAYPTDETDSIFLGPDTYRFMRRLKQHFSESGQVVQRAVDIGSGAGAAALTIATQFPRGEVIAADINDAALHLTAVNAELAGLPNVIACNSNLLTALDGNFDLIVSNPPFMIDHGHRTYRHGGGPLGCGLSLAIVDVALERLSPTGTLLLYTGAAIKAGESTLLKELNERLCSNPCEWLYEELDPDIFGEELLEPAYECCDRIAAVWIKVALTKHN
jgi:SAM-dependent methyltransferase